MGLFSLRHLIKHVMDVRVFGAVAALMSMKSKIRDETGVMDGWDINSVDPCTWLMVGCSLDGFVISLYVKFSVHFDFSLIFLRLSFRFLFGLKSSFMWLQGNGEQWLVGHAIAERWELEPPVDHVSTCKLKECNLLNLVCLMSMGP